MGYQAERLPILSEILVASISSSLNQSKKLTRNIAMKKESSSDKGAA